MHAYPVWASWDVMSAIISDSERPVYCGSTSVTVCTLICGSLGQGRQRGSQDFGRADERCASSAEGRRRVEDAGEGRDWRLGAEASIEEEKVVAAMSDGVLERGRMRDAGGG